MSEGYWKVLFFTLIIAFVCLVANWIITVRLKDQYRAEGAEQKSNLIRFQVQQCQDLNGYLIVWDMDDSLAFDCATREEEKESEEIKPRVNFL